MKGIEKSGLVIHVYYSNCKKKIKKDTKNIFLPAGSKTLTRRRKIKRKLIATFSALQANATTKKNA